MSPSKRKVIDQIKVPLSFRRGARGEVIKGIFVTEEAVGIISLGCAKNQVDAEVILANLLKDNKRALSVDQDQLDLLVINTCAFIEDARLEAYDAINEYKEWKAQNPSRKLVVSGCLPKKESTVIKAKFPFVDLFVTPNEINEIDHLIKNLAMKHKDDFETESFIGYAPRLLTTPEHLAYLKIADGCDNSCAFCTIPAIRGRFQSKSLSNVLKEANELASMGVKELVLIAQDSTAYGKDLGDKVSIVDLLTELEKIEGFEWIRIMYSYPDKITDDLINKIVNSKKILKYLDIPLQHISKNILKQMGRYNAKQDILELLKKLKAQNIIIRTSLIVGFPGETEDDFKELLDFVKAGYIDKLGVFKYSEESQTRAAKLSEKVKPEVIDARYDLIMKAQKEVLKKKNKQKEGQIFSAIIDNQDSGRLWEDAYEIDNQIFIQNVKAKDIGQIKQVKVLKSSAYDLIGEIV